MLGHVAGFNESGVLSITVKLSSEAAKRMVDKKQLSIKVNIVTDPLTPLELDYESLLENNLTINVPRISDAAKKPAAIEAKKPVVQRHAAIEDMKPSAPVVVREEKKPAAPVRAPMQHVADQVIKPASGYAFLEKKTLSMGPRITEEKSKPPPASPAAPIHVAPQQQQQQAPQQQEPQKPMGGLAAIMGKVAAKRQQEEKKMMEFQAPGPSRLHRMAGEPITPQELFASVPKWSNGGGNKAAEKPAEPQFRTVYHQRPAAPAAQPQPSPSMPNYGDGKLSKTSIFRSW